MVTEAWASQVVAGLPYGTRRRDFSREHVLTPQGFKQWAPAALPPPPPRRALTDVQWSQS